MPVGGRVAGKVTGIISNSYNGNPFYSSTAPIITAIISIFWLMPVEARVAGKATGAVSNSYNGRSYQGINEEIIWVSIGMGITIAILITIALCYIMREKCIQRREYYISA